MAHTRYTKWVALAFFVVVTLALQQSGIAGALASFVALALFAVLYILDETAILRETDLKKIKEQEERRAAEEKERKKKAPSEKPAAAPVPEHSAPIPEPNTVDFKSIVYDRAAEERKILQAARDGDLAAVTMLVEQGVSVDAENQNGLTPLMFAARFRHAPVVAYLIEQGADVNRKAKNGLTAMRIARENGDQAIIDLLSAGGALD